MLPNEGDHLVCWNSVDDGQAGQGCASPSATTTAGDLYAFCQSAFPSFVQDLPRLCPFAGQPEVGPAHPTTFPGDRGWSPAEQVDGEGWRRSRWKRPPQTTAPDEAAGWQAQDASAGRVPRVTHDATLGSGYASSDEPLRFASHLSERDQLFTAS